MDNSNNKLEIREKKLEDLNNNRTIDQEKNNLFNTKLICPFNGGLWGLYSSKREGCKLN